MVIFNGMRIFNQILFVIVILYSNISFAENRVGFSYKNDYTTAQLKRYCDENVKIAYQEQGRNAGIYLGLSSFNNRFESTSISLVDEYTESDFISFIDRLTMGSATVLYYSIDKAIESLDSWSSPDNIDNVILITFTDGLDNGSLVYNNNFNSGEEYGLYLNRTIANMKIQCCPIQSYVLGYPSEDVIDYNSFKSALNELASGSNYVTIGNMTDINNTLQEIADKLSEPVITWDFSFRLPIPVNGTVIRCTLDNKLPDVSDIWVEFTVNRVSGEIEDIVYHGMTSSAGNSLRYNVSNPFMEFSLYDCRIFSPDLEKPDMNVYTYHSSGSWISNSESLSDYRMASRATRSSVVILNLDCSSSLGSLFPKMQVMARSFVYKLCKKNIETKIGELILNEVGEGETMKMEYYNLQGVRVINPAAGIYICRKGGEVRKVILR